MPSQYCDTGFIDPHVTDGKRVVERISFDGSDLTFLASFSQLHSFGALGSVWHFPRHPWFSLAFIPFGFAAYTCGG